MAYHFDSYENFINKYNHNFAENDKSEGSY